MKMKGNIYDLSLHTYGCRVVQKAIEVFIFFKKKISSNFFYF